MTTDIIERLRDKAAWMEEVDFVMCAKLYRDAADRIEQLSTQTAEPEPNINAVWDAIAEYCWTYHEAMVPVIRPGAEQAYRAAGRALKALIGDRTDHDEAQSGIKTPSMKAK